MPASKKLELESLQTSHHSTPLKNWVSGPVVSSRGHLRFGEFRWPLVDAWRFDHLDFCDCTSCIHI